MTGDRILHSKLQSSVTHVHLRHHKLCDNAKPYQVPLLLSKFRSMRYLSLCSTDYLQMHLNSWQLLLSSLSPTIETLCLSSIDACRGFANHNPTGEYGRGLTTWIDFGSMFPSLTRLDLGVSSTICEPDLAGLPPTLRELKVGNIDLSMRVDESFLQPMPSWLQLLPRSLERLETKFPAYYEFNWQDAPPHLRFIGTVELVSESFPPFAQSIPSNITIGAVEIEGVRDRSRMLELSRTQIECLNIHYYLNYFPIPPSVTSGRPPSIPHLSLFCLQTWQLSFQPQPY